jgi:hypothetical protein
MSGFYNNWLKVQNPNMNNNIVPMESGGFQQPFFFGGSQIPTALGLKETDMDITGTGVIEKHILCLKLREKVFNHHNFQKIVIFICLDISVV